MQTRSLALLLSVSFVSAVACAPAETPPASNGGSPAATGGRGGSGRGGSGGANASGGSGGGLVPIGSGGSGAGGQGGSGGGGTGGGQPGGSGGTGGGAGNGVTGGAGGARTGGTGGGAAGGSGGTSAPDTAQPAEVGGGEVGDPSAKFSFFYTSLAGMRRLSKSQNGFGGDLRFGTDNGLTGADKICQTLAADVGFGHKTWKAFLSAFKGPDGMQVNAIDRIGEGPWYDRRGRLISMNKAGLLAANRPAGDSQAVNDLADENGEGRPKTQPNDTHDVITGTDRTGKLRARTMADTCNDWTSATTRGTIGMGHSWPAGSGMNWMQVHTEPTCVAGVNLVQNGPGNGSSIGAGGGWGGIYCFALQP